MRTEEQIWNEIRGELLKYDVIQKEIFKIIYENIKEFKLKDQPDIEARIDIFKKEEDSRARITELWDEMDKAKKLWSET